MLELGHVWNKSGVCCRGRALSIDVTPRGSVRHISSMLCARRSAYVRHPASQKLPQLCLWNSSYVRLTRGWSSSASSFHASLLKVIDGVVFLALRPLVVSLAPRHFRSSEKQATCEGCFAGHSICSIISRHSSMSKAVQPREFSKVDVDHWQTPQRFRISETQTICDGCFALQLPPTAWCTDRGRQCEQPVPGINQFLTEDFVSIGYGSRKVTTISWVAQRRSLCPRRPTISSRCPRVWLTAGSQDVSLTVSL